MPFVRDRGTPSPICSESSRWTCYRGDRHSLEQLDPPIEITDRFHIRRPFDGFLACHLQVTNGSARVGGPARLPKLVGEVIDVDLELFGIEALNRVRHV
jgi:hypothetical protein